MSYKRDNHGAMFWCTLDLDSVKDSDMTDANLPVSDIEPLEGLELTPGDIIPVGRDEIGGLVYLVDQVHTHVSMSRAHCALLASLLARDMRSDQPATEVDTQLNIFLDHLLSEAAPKALFEDSAHGLMERRSVQGAILDGKLNELPENLRLPQAEEEQ